MSINDIISQINRNYPAKAYNYEVRIFGGNGNIADATPEIMLNCSSINVPGINIGFVQDRRFSIGTVKNYAISKSFTELNLTFYETEYEMERKYFVDWINKIYDKPTKRFGYYQDYIKYMTIIQYDKKKNKTYECKVLECFPSNLSPLDKAYASGEMVPQFNVNIQFHEVEEIFYDKKESTGFFRLF